MVFCAILKISSSLFTVPLNRRTRVGAKFEQLQRWGGFSPENRVVPLSNFAGEWPKDSCFFLNFSIENPSKLPPASPGRKSKSHTFRAVEMRKKIHLCQPQTVPADCLFLIGRRLHKHIVRVTCGLKQTLPNIVTLG